MKFVNLHESHGIDIEDYFYSNLGHNIRINYKDIILFNQAFNDANLHVRLGPIKLRGKYYIRGDQVLVGLYLLKQNIKGESDLSLVSALNDLEKIINHN